MLSALEKALLMLAGKTKALREMPMEQILMKAGKGALETGKGAIGMAKEKPASAAALAGLGGIAGYQLGKPEEESDEDLSPEELMRKYGRPY